MFDPTSTAIKPRRKLGHLGASLWDAIQSEYGIGDPGGLEILMQCCEAADRVGALAEKINQDGEVILSKNGPRAHPALKDELAGRAFICKALERLGVSIEPIKAVGRPGGAGWRKREDRADADH